MSTPTSTYSQPGFRKKLAYGMIIVVLFGIMYPYTLRLEAVKKERDLGEAAIGRIDTSSFMMKLFLLGGFRGIVADYLWTRAEDYKKQHDWDRLAQTVEMITKLQPHFLAIWTYQSWNLAYNVAVEWDAPEDKYQWIKKGIQFVQQGVKKNQKSPDLVWDTAWYYYHKLGFSDESIILRRLFRDDEDTEFKKYYDPEMKQEMVGDDNFKLGYGWFSSAVRLVDSGVGVRVTEGTADTIQYVDPAPQRKGRPDDIAFRSMPAHGQTRYALSLEKMSMYGIPARFGEKAKTEWAFALNEWVNFGKHVFQSHNEILDPKTQKLYRDKVQLDDASDAAKLKAMSPNQRYWTERWADQMNYRYWKQRCLAEQTDEAVRAREQFYLGTIAYKKGEVDKAAAHFKEGLQVWKKALSEFPTYRDDDLCKKDTGLVVKRYVRALQQAGEPLPDDTPFKETLVLSENDPTVDPFDAIEIIGVPGGSASGSNQPTPAAPPSGLPTTQPATAPAPAPGR
jgi:hypothetical protein